MNPVSMDDSSDSTLTASRQRNTAFDILKALLILWVVWGHLQSTGFVIPSNGCFEKLLWRAKVANMPAFFAISGYFALSTFQRGIWSKILARVTLFAWPRATFAVAFVLAELLLFDIFVQQSGVVSLFWTIYRSRWFLRTLGALYLLSAALYRIGRTDGRRWFLFGITYLSLLTLPGRFRPYLAFAGGSQFVQMYPYFVLGFMVLRTRSFWRKRPVKVACLLFFAAIVLQEGLCCRIGLSTWRAPAVTWKSLLFLDSAFLHLAARTILGITGTITLFALADRLVRQFPSLSRLAPLGTTTMGVYIIHERPIYIAAAYGISLPSWTRIPLAICLFLLCHAIVNAIQKNRVTRIVFFGDEPMLRRVFEKLSFKTTSSPHPNQ